VAIKFLEHFTMIAAAINERSLWDEADGFYYDTVRRPADGSSYPVRVRSMTGLIPFCAVATAHSDTIAKLDEFNMRAREFLKARPEYSAAVDLNGPVEGSMLLALVGHNRLPRIIERLGDPDEFLSPYGIRSLSAAYRGKPFEFWMEGEVSATVDYEPAESTTTLFGGNSNWRGPVWFPVNHLVVGALDRYAIALGDSVTFEFPHGSGEQLTVTQIADEFARRLIALFLLDDDGHRPVFGDTERFRQDPVWRDGILFNEYFHGDNGAGLGASHQTGWTGLVADLVIRVAAARTAAQPTRPG
jgi:hypothetical protein